MVIRMYVPSIFVITHLISHQIILAGLILEIFMVYCKLRIQCVLLGAFSGTMFSQ